MAKTTEDLNYLNTYSPLISQLYLLFIYYVYTSEASVKSK